MSRTASLRQLVVVVEACEGGGIRIGEDEVDVFILEVITHLGGLFYERQLDLGKIHDGSCRLPPVGVSDKAGVTVHDIRTASERNCFVPGAVFDYRNVQQQRQALIGGVGGEDEGFLVGGGDRRDMAQARAIVDRAARGDQGICRVLRGERASV